MNRLAGLTVVTRVLLLASGFALISGLVYAAGLWLVPLVDGADKAILAACNPDEYLPGVDQFFRALTDYTNFLIAVPLLSWMVAYGVYRLFPRHKRLLVNVLIVETVGVAVVAALGGIWPNTVYTGANVLLVIFVLAAFGAIAGLFRAMDDDAMRRFARVFWLVLLSVCLTDFVATDLIKAAIARPRPLNDANKPWNEKVRIIPDEVLRGCNSYPSGHTSSTFALLTPWFWFTRNRKVRTGLMTWCVLQGFSRVYTAAHFPFCCLMGGILGFAVGTLVFFTLGGMALRPPAKSTAA